MAQNKKIHNLIIGVKCWSDVTGSQGLIMEIAMCEMFKARVKMSEPVFTLGQPIN